MTRGVLLTGPTLIACLAAAGIARADVAFWIGGRGFTGVSQEPAGSGAAFVPQLPNVVRDPPGGGLAGWYGGLYWCNDLGPATYISGAQVEAIRWHDPTPVRIEVGPTTDGSGGVSVPENQLTKGQAATLSIGGFATQCVGARARQTGTLWGSPQRIWNLSLVNVQITDQQGPSVGDLAVSGSRVGGWFTGAVTITWTSADNGVLRGRTWAQIDNVGAVDKGDAPNGAQSAAIDPGGDGLKVVRVLREGPNWPTASLNTEIRVDRTPPSIPVLSVTPGGGTVPVTVAAGQSVDATSGLAGYEYSADRGASLLATTTFAQSGTYRVQARAFDVAGNRSAWSPAITFTVAGASGAAAGGPSPTGIPTVALPDFSRVRLASIRAHHGRARNRVLEGRPVPYVLAGYGQRIAITGRFAHPNHRGLRGATVVLRGPSGRQLLATLTDKRGKFRLEFTPRVPGKYSVAAIGSPEVGSPVMVRLRPSVRLGDLPRRVRNGGVLVVRGELVPRAWARSKFIQLQYRAFGRWHPGPNGKVGRGGRFALKYRFTGPGGYDVVFRVAVPRERGWPFAPAVSRTFVVVIAP